MKVSVLRKKTVIINSIKNFFYTNRLFFCSLLIVFFVGLVTGIFVAVKKSDYLSSDLLEKFILFKFLSKDIGIVSFVFRKIIFVVLIGGIGYFLSRFKLSIILFSILVFFLSYYLGLLISTLIIFWGVVGLLNVLLIILPFEFFIYLIIIFYFVWLVNFNKCLFLSHIKTNEVLNKIFIFFGILFFLIIIEGIIINLLTNPFFLVI